MGFAHAGGLDPEIALECLDQARDNSRFAEPDEFVALVKANKVDNHAAVCFFVKNWNTPPDSIPRWKKRSGRLSKAGQKVGIARKLLKEPEPDYETILKNLMQDLDGIPV